MINSNKIFILSIISLFSFSQIDALVGLSNAKANSVIVQSDGKIVAAGTAVINSVQQGIIARYNSDGTPDSGFNGGSVATVIGDNAVFYNVIQQTDGKLVAVGSAGLTTAIQFFVIRYNTDGSLDTNFGTQGIVTSVQGSSTSANAVVQQSDGKLVIGGYSSTSGYIPRFFLARLNGNGTLDTTFGSLGNGYVFTPSGNTAQIVALKLQSDGKILATGPGQSNFLTMRYNTNGTLDTTYGSSGISSIVVGFYELCNASALQSDGKLIVAGFADNTFSLIRLNTNGTLDTTWGNAGRVTTAFASPAEAFSLALQSDGKAIAAGYMDNQVALARYTTTGALDATYGTSGQVTTQIGDMARALGSALQTDGKLVIAGYSTPNLFVSRYSTTGVVDNTFGVVSSPLVCSTSLCAFGQVYNVSELNVANNDVFTFDTAGILENISFTAPSSDIILDQGGTYAATYIVEAESQAILQFQLNGNVIQSSNFNSQNTCIAVGKAIFTANAGDVLTLVNVTGFDVGIVAGGINASIIIEKIA